MRSEVLGGELQHMDLGGHSRAHGRQSLGIMKVEELRGRTRERLREQEWWSWEWMGELMGQEWNQRPEAGQVKAPGNAMERGWG